jgi:hypothetical protein
MSDKKDEYDEWDKWREMKLEGEDEKREGWVVSGGWWVVSGEWWVVSGEWWGFKGRGIERGLRSRISVVRDKILIEKGGIRSIEEDKGAV